MGPARRQLKQETAALFLAYRDPRVPWYAKAWAALVIAYALSPIDLIPDPMPVLGHLDDLVIIPVGVLIALRLIPPAVMAEAREKAAAGVALPVSRAGGLIVVVLWVRHVCRQPCLYTSRRWPTWTISTVRCSSSTW